MYVDYISPSTTNSGTNAINNSITNILRTKRGSVPGQPRFGSDLHRLLFEQLDHITINAITRMIKESLGEFEPRVIIQDIFLKEVPEYNKVIVMINYKYRDNGVTLNDTVKLNLSA